jgi:ATP phosphoribosyltransferase regulatory subunit
MIEGENKMTFLNITDELNYQRVKFGVIQKLQELIIGEGYILFEPDFFEDYEAFVLKNKRVKKEKMIKLIDNDGTILVLRPDITTSLMRQIIPKWQNPSALRIFYNSTIFSRNPNGNMDSIRQFGIELLGEKREDADLEVLRLMVKMFESFGLDYVIEVTDTRFLEGLIDDIKLSDDEQRTFKDILYRKSLYDLNQFITSKQFSEDQKNMLNALFSLQGNLNDVSDMIQQLNLNVKAKVAFKELCESLEAIENRGNFMIDLSLVSTYDYYDGMLFKGYIKGSKEEVLSGGRYDPLTENFGKKMSAIGFTLNTQEVIKEVLRDE